MAATLKIFYAIAAICLALYYYLTKNYNFWKNRGVPGPEPILFFGSIHDVIMGKQQLGYYIKYIYETYKGEKMVGIFSRRKPTLILRDLDLIKDVLVKDFSTFSERGSVICEKVEPLSQNLSNLETARWRPLRTKLSPIFTSNKIKEMFPLIVECSDYLEKYIAELVEKGEPIECRDLMARYTTDVIGSCAFGIEMNALANKDCEFRKMGKKIFQTGGWGFVKKNLRSSFPWLYNQLGIFFYDDEFTGFFMRTILNTIKYRRKNSVVRHDFVNLLMSLQDNSDKVGIELTDPILVAQAFLFFFAGFETPSTTLSNAMYELALNPEVQTKLREEVHEELARTNGALTYDGIKNMKYLDKVFQETLRKYPIISFIIRQSIANYTFEGTKVTIPAGVIVWIPVLGIHRDPEIYPNPDAFDPERFSDKVAAGRHPMHHLPFGAEPRNCIDARFALQQTKIGLIKVVKDYQIDVCEKTSIPYVNNPKTVMLVPKNGIHLKITKLKADN